MIKPEQVPHAAMNALLLALRQRRSGKEALAAAINAWPHVGLSTHVEEGRRIILPLPQEPSDEA